MASRFDRYRWKKYLQCIRKIWCTQGQVAFGRRTKKFSITFTKKNGVINEEVALDDEVIVNSVTTLCHSDYNYIEQTFSLAHRWDFRIAAQGLCWKKRYANR
jgi:hypothetical protein